VNSWLKQKCGNQLVAEELAKLVGPLNRSEKHGLLVD